MENFKSCFLTLFISLFCFTVLLSQDNCASSFKVSGNCDVSLIGHRGASHVFPENTLLALDEAFKHGIKICEVDVSLSADSVYILMHDFPGIHRTTSGSGIRAETNLATYQSLDAGYWKEEAFAGEGVPTLTEALRLANAYGAQLYLDTKDLSFKHIAIALSESGVPDETVLIPLSDTTEALQMKQYIPNAPWVWFRGGLLPEVIDSTEFYAAQVRNGCVAFEVSGGRFFSNEQENFIDKVHAAGAQVWAFTVNDNVQASFLSSLGVDAMESDRPIALSRFLCLGESQVYPDSLVTGNWRFEYSLNDQKGLGSQLRLKNYNVPSALREPLFETCSSFGISTVNGIDTRVMKVPAQAPEGGLVVPSNFSVEDSSTEDFSYTVLLDLLLPVTSLNQYVALFQTSFTETSDAELFIDPANAVGIVGDYFSEIEANVWTRLAWVYDGGAQELLLYKDGDFIGKVETFSNRWAIFNSSPPGEKQGFLLFNDNDNETADLYLSALQICNYIIDSSQIKLMGGVDAAGFENHNADVYFPTILGSSFDEVLLNYDTQTYSVKIDTNTVDARQIPLSFKLSSGASSSITPGSLVDLSEPFVFTVSSESGLQQKEWTICPQLYTHLNENAAANSFTLFPNPSEGLFVLKAYKPYKSLKVVSMMGKLVYEQNKGSQINLEAFNAGVYLITLEYLNGTTSSQKVVKL